MRDLLPDTPPVALIHMREWLTDCLIEAHNDVDANADGWTDRAVLAYVARHYDGGTAGFLRDSIDWA